MYRDQEAQLGVEVDPLRDAAYGALVRVVSLKHPAGARNSFARARAWLTDAGLEQPHLSMLENFQLLRAQAGLKLMARHSRLGSQTCQFSLKAPSEAVRCPLAVARALPGIAGYAGDPAEGRETGAVGPHASVDRAQ